MTVTVKLKNREIPRTWIDVSKIEESGRIIILWFRFGREAPISINKNDVENLQICFENYKGVKI